MCVALPGRVTAIDGSMAKVDFNGSLVPVNLGLVQAKLGDYVLVHAGCAVQVLQQDAADELFSIMAELEALTHGDD